MFDHVSIGVADIGRSKTFYDAALKPLGFSRLSDGETSLGYGDKSVALWLGATSKPVKSDMESGLHFCLSAKDRAAVDAFHAAALKAGGKDNGEPGPRQGYAAYAAFAFDPDGNNVEAVIWEGEPRKSERRRRAVARGKTSSPARKKTRRGRRSL